MDEQDTLSKRELSVLTLAMRRQQGGVVQRAEARERARLFYSPIHCRSYLLAIATKHSQRSAVDWTRHAHHELRGRAAVAAGDNVAWIDTGRNSFIGHGLTQQDPADC
jgi:hypothetical protein